MSTNLVPFSFDTPVVGQQNKQVIDDLYGAALKSGVPHISLNNGTFFIHDASGAKVAHPERHLDVVIIRVKQKDNRTFWMKQMKPGEPTGAPDCWSNDGDRPHAPEENRPVVVGADGLQRSVISCAECPKNAPNSHPSGSGKACSWKKRIAVFLANDIGGTPLLLRVGSLSWSDKLDANYRGPRALKSYIQFLVANQRNPGQLVTRLTFNPNNSVASVQFAPATDANGNAMGLNLETQQLVLQASSSDAVKRLMEVTDEDADAATDAVTTAPANRVTGTVSAQAPAAAPVPVPPPAPVPAPAPISPPAPVRRTPAPAPAPTRPALRADFSASTNDAMHALKASNPTEWEANGEWAMHPTATETEVLDWIKDVTPVDAAPPAPVAPPPAPAAPVRKGRPPKATPPTAAPTSGQDFQALLGMQTDDL